MENNELNRLMSESLGQHERDEHTEIVVEETDIESHNIEGNILVN